jgi:serine/threonine-protein kinase
LGKYELIEEAGRGGFAVVYRARDTQMGREVALKAVRGNPASEQKFTERFYLEARTAASLRHPNIIPVYDFGEAEGTLYLAMPFVGAGRTLCDLLRERAPLSLEQVLPILTQVADALVYLQEQEPPLVHRDVKPANVLLEGGADRPTAILTDFGLVRSMEASTELTRSGTLLGTPAYMAPEQADPGKWGEVTPLTDVYALSVVAYEMLTGEAPFAGETLSVLRAHADDPPPSPLERLPDLGEDLAQVLLRALAKPPGERYPDARALVDALRQVAEERVQQEEQQAALAGLLAEAQAARQAGDWLTVQDRCVRVMQIDRMHSEALQLMAEATAGLQRESEQEAARRRRAELYERGIEAQDAEHWQAALEAFEGVAAGNPDYRDVQERLAQVRAELQSALWYDEAIAHGEEERWAEACRTWLHVLRERLDYRQGDAVARFLDAVTALLGQYDALGTKPDRSQGLVPPAFEPGETMVWEKDGKEMVFVEAGSFLYGPHKIEVDLPAFWIDRTPVTNAEYAHFVQDTDHKPPIHWQGAMPPNEITEHPVVRVSWRDAQAYAEWAGKRLPTEEQWEKAARGIDGRVYPWGDWEPDRCNTKEAEIRGTTPVGRYSPQGDSPYGCVDVAGNVWEWTASEHERGGRVLRGGSWYNNRSDCGCAARDYFDPDYSYYLFGFRVVSPISLS